VSRTFQANSDYSVTAAVCVLLGGGSHAPSPASASPPLVLPVLSVLLAAIALLGGAATVGAWQAGTPPSLSNTLSGPRHTAESGRVESRTTTYCTERACRGTERCTWVVAHLGFLLLENATQQAGATLPLATPPPYRTAPLLVRSHRPTGRGSHTQPLPWWAVSWRSPPRTQASSQWKSAQPLCQRNMPWIRSAVGHLHCPATSYHVHRTDREGAKKGRGQRSILRGADSASSRSACA
jgi:hypothetical protein